MSYLEILLPESVRLPQNRHQIPTVAVVEEKCQVTVCFLQGQRKKAFSARSLFLTIISSGHETDWRGMFQRTPICYHGHGNRLNHFTAAVSARIYYAPNRALCYVRQSFRIYFTCMRADPKTTHPFCTSFIIEHKL